MEREVVPPMMNAVAHGEEVRVWVVACASGEESYSVAILRRC
ncbi:CheR family methyltransferase [Acidovorax sp. SRB_24]